ncbi:MAG TPA: DUF5047 domain-containing protein [Actinophytocola sp.]|jgi:hypothetical protein|nr:DUF5047 domain-containing protein [Actinophytocola sp.]
MRPVSDEFLRTLRGSHRAIFRALVVEGHQTGVNPVGVEIPIDDGDIEFDSSANVRATLDLTTDPTYWPTDTDSLITPYGTEIFIARGVMLGAGQKVYVSQGYYRVNTTEQDDAPRGPVRISGADRMAGIVDGRLEKPVQFLAGASVATVFSTLVLDVYPNATIEYDFDADATTFPGSHITEQDRYGFLNDVVRALGKVWYWDYRGVLVVKDPPDPGDPAWDINHGRSGVLITASRERTRDGVYNSVVATGEAPGDAPPALAIARDIATDSPIRWGGPFGKVPRFYSSPFITTNDQAGTAAVAILTQSRGLPYTVSFDTVVNPALEVLDPIRVSYSDRERVEVHVIDKLTLPLVADTPMRGTTRDQSSINVEVEAE